MNLNDFILILAAEVRKPFDFPTQQIAKDLAITARAKFIRQQYEKTKRFPNSAITEICINTYEKNSTECCGIDLGCKVIVTDELPVPIDVKDEIMFNYVGGLDSINPFGYIKPDEIRYIPNRKFSSKLPYYTWLNRKLIIFNKPSTIKLKVRYVPSNPYLLEQFKGCAAASCFDSDTFIFIEDHWEHDITQLVLPKLNAILNEQVQVNESQQQ